MNISRAAIGALVVALCAGVAITPAAAQDFYRGKTLTIQQYDT